MNPNERVRASTGGDKLIHNLSNTLTSRGLWKLKGSAIESKNSPQVVFRSLALQWNSHQFISWAQRAMEMGRA